MSFLILSPTFCSIFIWQWQGTGAPGYLGVHAVRPVGRACIPESGCVTTLPLLLMDHIVKAQTPRLKCAKTDHVLVSAKNLKID